ncbi:MAG: PepSY domain-containing protein [Acidobacteria bacterium]|nr:PepSY domain-containing protein [Acidobacteriota bacterium]
MSFLVEPRKIWWRKALFQVHLWLGVGLGLYFAVVCLTGSVIVYKKEMERAMIPQLIRVAPLEKRVSFQGMVDTVRAAYPKATLQNVYLYWTPGTSWSFRMQSKTEGRIQVYVDPYRGTILGEDRYRGKFLQWVYDLHVNLLMGDLGEWLNGWGGFSLAIVSLSGIVVWWPGKQYWKNGFVYEFRARWKRQNYDMHKVGGLVSSVFLILPAVTGAYWSFPAVYEEWIEKLTGTPAKVASPRVEAVKEWVSLDVVLDRAIQAVPGGTPTLFRLAAKPTEVHSLHHILPWDWRTQGDHVVYLHPGTGEVVRVTYHHEVPLGARIQRDIFGLHFGTFAGDVSRVSWVLVGVAPTVLFVTGVLMWWNRSLSKKWRKSAR